MQRNEIVLRVEHLNKSFTATKAVVDVTFDIFKGEVRGLIGENGSGKSTLASMISGSLKPDSGSMQKSGESYTPASMLDGRSKGISILVQEMGTIDGLSVAENIFLGKEMVFSTAGLINKKRMIQEARQVLKEIDASYIDPRARIEDISFEDRKLIEVAMAVHDNPDILILDETTTALSQKGRSKVYNIIDTMKKAGKTVLLISHDLTELKDHCDNITILRDGCLVQTLEKSEITLDRMRKLMIGRDLSDRYYREDTACSYQNEVVLKAENLFSGTVIKDVSFELHKGEILGIGGLTDCGMHELCKVIFGVTKPDHGIVTVLPKGVTIRNAQEAVANKIAYIPKNREQEAMMVGASVKDNISLMSYDKLRRGPIITRKSERMLAQEQANLLKIKMVSVNQLCMYLSGGNKQKVVISKWLANDSEILVMDCPTRGIDIGVKAAIYRLMEDLKNTGKSIIMISEELPELLGMSDRIIILKDGKVSSVFERCTELSEEIIIQAMI